jgi:type I restriction enzyme S subunit
MSDWKEYSLKDAIEKFIDYRGKTPVKVTQGIPLITAKVIKDGSILTPDEFIQESEYLSWMTRGFPKKTDVLLTTEAPLGEVAMIKDENIALAQRIILLRGKPDLLVNHFLFYSLQTDLMQHRLKARASGSTVQGIKSSELKEVMIPLPDVTEQKRIADVLSCLDAKIENLRRQNETLEQIAQTLFKHWFIDFEFPFDFAQGKPNAEGKPYKSSGGAMFASELGDIPKGWKISTIGDEVETVGGGTPSTTEPSYWENGDIPWYSPTDLTKAKTLFSIDSEKKITKLGLQKSSARLFPKYSLLLTSRATIGEVTINTKEACTNQGFITIIPNAKFSVYFLYGWLLTKIGIIKQLASGSTFPEISKTNFRGLDFLIPVINILEKYEQLTKPIYKKIETNIFQIQALTKTRDSLLPKLMSGQHRVKP